MAGGGGGGGGGGGRFRRVKRRRQVGKWAANDEGGLEEAEEQEEQEEEAASGGAGGGVSTPRLCWSPSEWIFLSICAALERDVASRELNKQCHCSSLMTSELTSSLCLSLLQHERANTQTILRLLQPHHE